MQCGACNKQLRPKGDSSKESTVGCAGCSLKYHASCLNLARDEMRQIRTTGTVHSCPSCQTKKRNQNSDSTPIRMPAGGASAAGDLERGLSGLVDGGISSLCASAAHSSCGGILKEMEGAFMKMKREMEDFTSSLNSTTEDIFEFRKEINDLKKQVKELDHYKTEVNTLRLEVADLRREIVLQQQRQYLRDIEITGLTEHKQENLFHTVSILSAKLGVELDPKDIDDVRRVGTRESASSSQEALHRPRPVIVTLVRRAPRDQLLRAARVRRDITTDKIEVPGNPRKVFINEHLTKENRILFSKARAAGKGLNFKYVWSSNGTIFMRRTDTSSVLRVTTEAVLDRLVGDAKTPTPLSHQQCS